ncbi:MAG: branched-chain amino acid ABC transporter permease [Chloroflexota bacterium]
MSVRVLGASAAVLAIAGAMPWLLPRDDVLNLLFLVFLHVALGQSWNILAGYAGQVSLGHAAFFGVGALAARTLWLGGIPFPLALLGSGFAAVAVAVIVGVPTFRLRGIYFSIGTLGIAEALRITAGNLLPLVSALPPETLASYSLTPRYLLALGLAATTILASHLLLRSRLGLGMLAVREDEDAAQSLGVDALRHKLLALVLSSLFTGLAGGTFAYYHPSYYPELAFNPTWTFDALLITFVGGMGTLFGPALGAVFFVLVREQLAVTLVQLHQIIFGVLFIAVVLLLPGGLVEAWDRIHQRVHPPTTP